MIPFDECSKEIQNRLNSYLYSHNKFTSLLLLNSKGNDGWVELKSSGHGEIPLVDEAWLRGFATEFRKFVAQDEPLLYSKMVQVFFDLFESATREEKTKCQQLLKILSNYKKRLWDVLEIPTIYDGKLLTAENIIDITHNGYVFHTGQTKLRNNKVSHELVRKFGEDYPEYNPLMLDYLKIVSNRQIPLAALAACIEQFKLGTLLQLELVENITPISKSEQQLILLDLTTGKVSTPEAGTSIQLIHYL